MTHSTIKDFFQMFPEELVYVELFGPTVFTPSSP